MNFDNQSLLICFQGFGSESQRNRAVRSGTGSCVRSFQSRSCAMWLPSVRLVRLAGLGLAFVALIEPGILRAQDTGTMSGFVKDPSGAVVARAKVTVTM